jgi:hypothetical protein
LSNNNKNKLKISRIDNLIIYNFNNYKICKMNKGLPILILIIIIIITIKNKKLCLNNLKLKKLSPKFNYLIN